MYLLYTDESGSVDDPNADIFVLPGICVFERQTHWLDDKLTMVEALKIPAHQPTSVGAMLKEEFLEPLSITQGELAKAMGVGRKTVNELCGGRRGVTAETAFLLAKVLGTTPEFWLNLQFMNDMWLAKHNEVLAEKLEHARPLVAA